MNLKSGVLLAAISSWVISGCGDKDDDPKPGTMTATPVISSFSASPDKVAKGGMVTLTYAVSSAQTVEITSSTGDAPLSSSSELSGMVTTHAIDADTTFTLTAKNGSESATQTVTVTVQAPDMVSVTSFSVSPAEVDVGQTAALTWETANATSVSIATSNGTEIVADGNRVSSTENVMPSDSTVYVLTANGEGGPVTAMVTLTVNRPVPVIASFIVMPNAITLGDATTLSWNVMGATAIKVTDSSGTDVYDGADAMSMASVSPTANETYTLLATNQFGMAEQTVMVTVNDPDGASINSFVARPDSVLTGRPSVLAWDVTNAPDGVTISEAGSSTTATASASLTGRFTVTPTITTNYTLTALNAQWGDSTNTITVRVSTAAPDVRSFTSSLNPGPFGGEVTLSWEAWGADTVRILRMSPNATEILSTAVGTGSAQVTLTSTRTWFSLEATNLYGGANTSLEVFAERQPEIEIFEVDPQTFVQTTTTATVSWEVNDATAIEIFDNGVSVHTSTLGEGTWSSTVTTTKMFELVATSAGGQDRAVALIAKLDSEVEPNDTSSTAIALSGNGGGAAGTIGVGGDVDWYAVSVTTPGSGIDAKTSDGSGGCTLDTFIELYDSMGNLLGSDDDGGFGSCSAFDPFRDTFAADLDVGIYYVRVRAYSSLRTGSYVLQVYVRPALCGNGLTEGLAGERCDDGNTVDGDNCTATCDLPVDGSLMGPGLSSDFNGALDPAGDADFYRVELLAPGYIVAETFAPSAPGCTDADTVITLLDDSGAQLARDDNGGVERCSRLDPTLTPQASLRGIGTYFVQVSEASNALLSAYQLSVQTIGQGCGNGILEAVAPFGETCDDGNQLSGDGCDSTCQFEGTSEQEPNDDWQNANFITSSTIAGTSTTVIIRGSLDPTGDADVFGFDVPEGYHVKAHIGVNSLEGCVPFGEGEGIRLRGYNSTGGTWLPIDSYSANIRGRSTSERLCGEYHPNIFSQALRMTAGTYYVQLNAYSRSAAGTVTENQNTILTYFLHLSIVAPECGNGIVDTGEQCDDSNLLNGDGCSLTCDYEILDTVTSSASIAVPLPETTSFRVAQVDITTPGQSITATAADPGCTIDTFLNFADVDFRVIASDGSDGPGDCAAFHVPRDVALTDLSTGTYFLSVVNQGSTVGQTVLDVTVIDPACGNGIVERKSGESCDDGNTTSGDGCDAVCVKEPNGFFTLPSATATVTEGISTEGERDWFEVTVTSPVYLDASVLVPDPATGILTGCAGEDLRMWLYAGDGTTQLGFDDDDGPGFCPQFTPGSDAFTKLDPGTFFIEVASYYSSGSGALIDPYALIVSGVAADVCGNGVGESYNVTTGTITVPVTEECDDGNTVNTDACVAGCLNAFCGDGFVQAGIESCDDGIIGGGPCPDNCQNTPQLTGNSTPALAIPDNDPSGLQDTIVLPIAPACVVNNLQIGVDISHTYIGDLEVDLTSPAGVTVRLHNTSGGGSDNIVGTYPTTLTPDNSLAPFTGNNANGNWTIQIVDTWSGDVGALNSWDLTVNCQ